MLANTNSRCLMMHRPDGVSQRLTDVKQLSSIAELPRWSFAKKAAPDYSPDAAGASFAFG